MKILTIILFSILTMDLYSQTIEYKFEGDGKSWNDKLFSFKMTRTYLNDSIFIDSPLICSSDTASQCSIRFKKIDNDWFIMADGDWQEFYDSRDSLIKVVYFKKEKFILKPVGHTLIDNNVKLNGFVKEKLYVHTCDYNVFWFDRNLGVVIIEGDKIYYRQDYKKNGNQ